MGILDFPVGSDIVLIDGDRRIDLDWEFPTIQGIGCNKIRKQDTDNLLAFVKVPLFFTMIDVLELTRSNIRFCVNQSVPMPGSPWL